MVIQSKIKHVAIIMDGNGRWAQERGRPRLWGHIRGVRRVPEMVEAAVNLSLSSLTLYAFSTENWRRPPSEVSGLLLLFKKFLKAEARRLIEQRVRFHVIGRRSHMPQDLLALVSDMEAQTAHFEGLRFNLAFDYGGRAEIVDAVNLHLQRHPGQPVSEEGLGHYLYDPFACDIDLIIRTGGDSRISNFLLWQSAYAELFFTPIQWPDFSPQKLSEILQQVAMRERRFGGLGAVHQQADQNSTLV